MRTPSSPAANLDALARTARDARLDWDEARAGRVLATALVLRDKRAARARLARRSMALLSAASVVIVMLLRGASAPASTTADAVEPSGRAALAANVDLLDDGDGGYGRD